MSYSVIKLEEFDENVFHLIDKDWFLIPPSTAGWSTP